MPSLHDADPVAWPLLDGWFLIRARRTCPLIRVGHYGFHPNGHEDLACTFPGPFVLDPLFDCTDEYIEGLGEDDPMMQESLLVSLRYAAQFERELKMSPEEGEHLVRAAKKAGWEWPGKDPYLAHWLFERCARLVASGEPKPYDYHAWDEDWSPCEL